MTDALSDLLTDTRGSTTNAGVVLLQPFFINGKEIDLVDTQQKRP